MVIIRIVFMSTVLTDLRTIRQNIEIKNTFSDTLCKVLVVKKYW